MALLEATRKAAGLNISQFAKRLGVSRQMYYSYITGVSKPKLHRYLNMLQEIKIIIKETKAQKQGEV
ncbi:MAG: helix-turn-helix transcriptional regulator [Candidatus Caldarchaeum sp.]